MHHASTLFLTPLPLSALAHSQVCVHDAHCVQVLQRGCDVQSDAHHLGDVHGGAGGAGAIAQPATVNGVLRVSARTRAHAQHSAPLRPVMRAAALVCCGVGPAQGAASAGPQVPKSSAGSGQP